MSLKGVNPKKSQNPNQMPPQQKKPIPPQKKDLEDASETKTKKLHLWGYHSKL